MTFLDITVYYLDGTKEEYYGDCLVKDGRLVIFTQHNGSIKIPLTSIKKYITK